MRDRWNCWKKPRGFVGVWDAFHYHGTDKTLADELRAFRRARDPYALPGAAGPEAQDPNQRDMSKGEG